MSTSSKSIFNLNLYVANFLKLYKSENVFLIFSNWNENFTRYEILSLKFFPSQQNIIPYYWWEIQWSLILVCWWVIFYFSLENKIHLSLKFLRFIIMCPVVGFLIFPVVHYFVSSFKSKAFQLSLTMENSISIIFFQIFSFYILASSVPMIRCQYYF